MKWRRAILAAVSMASPPPEPRNTRASSMGAWAASRAHSSLAGWLPKSPKVEYASILRICADTASAISGRACPRLAYQSDAVASR
jgi:hypothetical protein